MYFTLDDYRKIEQWLNKRGVKDTEFPDADTLTDKDYIPVIQDERNKKLSVMSFTRFLETMTGNFINVSSVFNKYGITLREAINTIPDKSRRIGLIITFLNEDNEWVMYQFNSDTLDEWSNENKWVFTYENASKFKGLFKSGEELLDSVRNPLPGDYAFVGESMEEAELWICEEKGTWKDTYTKAHRYADLFEAVHSKDFGEFEAIMDEFYADRAEKDALGNIIHFTYITREGFSEYVLEKILNTITNVTLPDGSIGLEQLNEALRQYIRSGGNVTNMADEEDLTVIDDVIKFKDKKYRPYDFSGKGRKFLRKNMAGGLNVLEQYMFDSPDTIYIIQYDYCLNGATIEIPENSVLRFEGGSFNGGTIVLNNTRIEGEAYEIDVDTEVQSRRVSHIVNNTTFINMRFEGTYAVGQQMFHKDLRIPVWWNGDSWITQEWMSIDTIEELINGKLDKSEFDSYTEAVSNTLDDHDLDIIKHTQEIDDLKLQVADNTGEIDLIVNDVDAIRNSLVDTVSNLNTLLNDNPTEAINNFNEIIKFLEGIEDTESLDSIIKSIETQISQINTNIDNIISGPINNLSNEIDGINSDISDLQDNKVDKTDFNQYKTDTDDAIDNLDVDLTSTKADIVNINKDIDRIDGALDILDGELANKVNRVDGKGLSSNDFTDTYKSKLDDMLGKQEINDKFELKVDKTEVETALSYKANLEQVTQIESSINSLESNKVSKVEGKQLSTEDFTTALKTKLEGLTNYNDAELSSKVDELKVTLDTILDSDNTTAVIDTWQEIEAFLAGITNTETLTGLLNDLKSDILALCADTYVKKVSCITISDGGNYINASFPSETLLDKATGNGFIECFDSGKWWNFKAGKYIVNNGTNSQFLKADGSLDSTAYVPVNGDVEIGGTKIFNKSIVQTLTIAQGGNGIAKGLYYKINKDDTDIANGLGVYRGIDITTGEEINRYWYIGWGNIPHSVNTSLAISDTRFTYKNNKVWHEGNDGDGSGLDADKLDGKHNGELTAQYLTSKLLTSTDNIDNVSSGLYEWKNNNNPQNGYDTNVVELNLKNSRNDILQIAYSYNAQKVVCRYGPNKSGTMSSWHELAFTDSNVASADKLTTKLLTNEDLNEIKEPGTTYYAINTNTCANLPPELVSKWFNLQVFRTGNNDRCQILIGNGGITYIRYWNSASWSSWQQLATTDGAVARITAKQLTNENLDNIKYSNFSLYYGLPANTCTNKPTGVTGFSLQVHVYGNLGYIQILNSGGSTYRRVWDGSSWSAWVKMATVEDAVAKLTTKQLTNEDLNTIKDVNFSIYFALSDNTCNGKPSNVEGFNLICFGSNINYCTQIIRQTSTGYLFKRDNIGGGNWSAWKKMLTEDDVQVKLVTQAEYDALTTKNSNTLYCIAE